MLLHLMIHNRYETSSSKFMIVDVCSTEFNEDSVRQCLVKYFGEDLNKSEVDDVVKAGTFTTNLWCDDGEETEIIITVIDLLNVL